MPMTFHTHNPMTDAPIANGLSADRPLTAAPTEEERSRLGRAFDAIDTAGATIDVASITADVASVVAEFAGGISDGLGGLVDLLPLD